MELNDNVKPCVNINGRVISAKTRPYLIAEMSANHNGSIEGAMSIIRSAKAAGADAIKIQSYTPDTITMNCSSSDFQIKEGLWAGKTLYELYQEAHLPFEWHQPLFEYAREIGISIFSTPFDKSAVDLLESLDAPAYKIASFEAVDIPLIRHVASTGKPLIISTGMATFEEIEEAVAAARDAGCDELILLKCVSAYPAQPHDYNLNNLLTLRNNFNTLVGLSDHTLTSTTAIASVALGACVIEKHFTLNRAGGGPDDSFSIEPVELQQLRQACDEAHEALGDASINIRASETPNKQFRRSLYYCRNIYAGEVLTEDAIKSVRPGYGLPPKYFDDIIGKIVSKDIVKHTPITWDDFVPSQINLSRT